MTVALYRRTGLSEVPAMQAARLPETRVRDYSFIKYQLIGHRYRVEISSLLEERARAVGYDADLAALPGSGLRYAAKTWLSQLRHPPQPKAWAKQGPLRASA